MKILNYGGGAVGLGLDSCLIKSGTQVDIVARPPTAAALKKRGLTRRGIFGPFKAGPKSFGVYTSLNKLPKGAYDFILVTVKSFDSRTAAKDLARYPRLFNEETKIVLCQNGWGNAEIFTKYFPKSKIYNARIITGFIRPKPNEVTVTVHADSVLMGSLFNGNVKVLKTLCHAVAKGGLPCTISQKIEKDLWAKMLYNCALNPLGAIFNVPYGILGEHANTRSMMNEIIHEVFVVMKKAGYTTHWASPENYLKVFYSKQLPATYRHNSSTLQDIRAGKKTEIDSLNGVIVKLAQRFKTPAPVNRAVYQIVKSVGKGRRV